MSPREVDAATFDELIEAHRVCDAYDEDYEAARREAEQNTDG